MSDREIKVKDKRMFTADGELREEYRGLSETPGVREAEGGGAAAPSPPETPRPRSPAPEPPPSASPGASGEGAAADRSARVEIPGSAPGPGTPGFADLLAVLAEPVAVYLGDAKLPDGGSAENLEAARIYIDLLDVLRQKTLGNLSAQESGLLEDVLYQLRMRYVQKRG